MRTRVWHSSVLTVNSIICKVAACQWVLGKVLTKIVLFESSRLCGAQYNLLLMLLPRALRRSKRKCLFRSATFNVSKHRRERAHEEGIWSVCWTSKNQVLSGSVDEQAKLCCVHSLLQSDSDSNLCKAFRQPGRRARSHDLEKVEKPIHTLDGHRLGVISVKANSTGTGDMLAHIQCAHTYY
eukprot:16940-Heterococcus_DN1.PRE.2